MGTDGQPTEYGAGGVGVGAAAAVNYYSVTVKLDSGSNLVVRVKQAPTLSAGAAVNVLNGQLVAR